MAFNLGASSNTGKLHMADFLSSAAVQNDEKDLPIDTLVPWENQPFRMYSAEKLQELANSIKENGLLSRIIVCPIADGKYRIIAGHNRVEACRLAGIANIPSIIKDVDENRAKLIMADTNLCQRTELLPSERAFAYKAQQEALIALGSPRATMEIAEKYGEGRRTIQRYIACSQLVPELMDKLDSGQIKLLTAVSFSRLPESSQYAIASYLSAEDRRISDEQAGLIAERKFVTEDDVENIVGEKKVVGATQKSTEKTADNNSEKKTTKSNAKITFKRKEITDVIGDELTNDEIAEFFYFCLQKSDFMREWRKMHQDSEQPDDEELCEEL